MNKNKLHLDHFFHKNLRNHHIRCSLWRYTVLLTVSVEMFNSFFYIIFYTFIYTSNYQHKQFFYKYILIFSSISSSPSFSVHFVCVLIITTTKTKRPFFIDPNIRQCFFLEIHIKTRSSYIQGLDFDMSIIHPWQ